MTFQDWCQTIPSNVPELLANEDFARVVAFIVETRRPYPLTMEAEPKTVEDVLAGFQTAQAVIDAGDDVHRLTARDVSRALAALQERGLADVRVGRKPAQRASKFSTRLKKVVLVQDGIATNDAATALIMRKNAEARVEQRAEYLMAHAGKFPLTVDDQQQIRKLAATKRKVGHFENGRLVCAPGTCPLCDSKRKKER